MDKQNKIKSNINNLKLKNGLSDMASRENSRLSTMSPSEMVKQYVDLDDLPINKNIVIDKIAVMNWNPLTRSNTNVGIKYGMFTDINSEKYPEGKDHKMDYMPDEEVSPIIIIDDKGKNYKVDILYWFPLIDVHDGIVLKQSITQERILPNKIFIDESIEENGGMSNKWVPQLLNLVGHRVLNVLKNQN